MQGMEMYVLTVLEAGKPKVKEPESGKASLLHNHTAEGERASRRERDKLTLCKDPILMVMVLILTGGPALMA